jgi:hypothetical protein
MIEVSGAHRMRMQLHTAEVDDPREASRIIDDYFLRGTPRRERQGDRAHPLRQVARCALLVEGLCLRTIHKAFQNDWAIQDTAQRTRRHGEKIADDIEFCELHAAGEVRLGRAANAHHAANYLQQLRVVYFRHHNPH